MEQQRHLRSLVWFTPDPKLTAMGFYQPFDNGQTEAGTLVAPVRAVIEVGGGLARDPLPRQNDTLFPR